jgi:hypothetical protein
MKKKQEKDLTRVISQVQVVAMAVFFAGGDQRAIDTEDVAIRADQLAPGRFSWRKYPKQINLELVRVYLSDAKRREKGSLVVGTGKIGWRLTPKGLAWAKGNSRKFLKTDLRRQRSQSKSGSIDENRWRRERERVLATAAWKKWLRGNSEITTQEASEVFRADSYAIGSILGAKITRLRGLLADDLEIDPFLARMAKLLEGKVGPDGETNEQT